MARSRFVNARSLFLVGLVVAAFFVWTAIVGELQTQRIGQEQRAAEQELTALKDKKAYILAVKQYAASDAYVEQEARRQLGYTRGDEVAFVVVSPPEPAGQNSAAGDWWQRLFPK